MSHYPPEEKLQKELHSTQLAFIEWLCDASNERETQAEFARQHNVAPKTLSRWKKETAFREMWDQRLAELNVAPDRLQRVVDALYGKAIGGDSRAANLYLQYVERFTPRRNVVIEDKSAKDLSDDELAEQLEQSARHLRAV